MQEIKEIINKSHDSKGFKTAAEIIRKEFLVKGYVKTNMGWLHKDWIAKGLDMKAIAFSPDYSQPPNYLYFNVKVEVSEYEDNIREGRRVIIVKKEKLTFINYSTWLLWIEEQNKALGPTKNINKSDSKKQLKLAEVIL